MLARLVKFGDGFVIDCGDDGFMRRFDSAKEHCVIGFSTMRCFRCYVIMEIKVVQRSSNLVCVEENHERNPKRRRENIRNTIASLLTGNNGR